MAVTGPIPAASTWFLGITVNDGHIQANIVDPANTAFNAIPVVYKTSFTITPSAANVATSLAVAFPAGLFSTAPSYVDTQVSSSASAVLNSYVTGVTTTGCLVWLLAPNTTPRGIMLRAEQ